MRGHFSHLTVVFDALELARNVIKYFGRRHVLGIQRWGSDLTVRISLQDLGEIKSPSFLVSYIKAPEYHFLLSSSQFIIFRAFKPSNSLTIRSFVILPKRDFKDSQKLQRSIRVSVYISFNFTTPIISSALHFLFYKLKMGRFECLVKNLALIKLFKEKYHIP